ncbi:hypothetical protein FA13DRAFT_1816942 [Coprinellus micaceus]|uniref:Uncharacterized protein n=1 Tax=Coprinellus micaceus TaxID=71717 RepID=A0A4Y7SXB7_COPMI|nr:hypothetical protein FA13DRAFT_1816942 [Coprinellus micaceus]
MGRRPAFEGHTSVLGLQMSGMQREYERHHAMDPRPTRIRTGRVRTNPDSQASPNFGQQNLTTVFLLHYLAFLAVVVVFKTLGTDASIHVPSHCALWCVFQSCWIGTAGWVESRKKWVELGKEWVGLVRRSGMWEKVEVGEAK